MDYRPYADLHQSFNGPGDDRPTALRILEDNDLLGKLTDKTILVTGATAALGQETVRQLAKTGAEVWFTARDEAKADAVMIALREEAKSDSSLAGAKVDWLKVENGSLESVEQCAQEFMKRSKRLNVLICNAGKSTGPHIIDSGEGCRLMLTRNFPETVRTHQGWIRRAIRREPSCPLLFLPAP